jgi:hypothetical protein
MRWREAKPDQLRPMLDVFPVHFLSEVGAFGT